MNIVVGPIGDKVGDKTFGTDKNGKVILIPTPEKTSH